VGATVLGVVSAHGLIKVIKPAPQPGSASISEPPVVGKEN